MSFMRVLSSAFVGVAATLTTASANARQDFEQDYRLEVFTPGAAAALLQLLEQRCLDLQTAIDLPCDDLLRNAVCNPLPPGGFAEIEALLRCADCVPECVGTGEPPPITCPGENRCGESALSACEALKQTLRAAAICHIGKKLADDPAAPISRPDLDRALGAAACAFLTECATESPLGGSTPPMSCLALVQCLGWADSGFRQHLTADFFCALFSSGCAGCYQELCALDGKGSHEECDLNGDGSVTCDDLKLLIEIKKGCACADTLGGGGGTPGDPTPGVLSPQEVIGLACAFFGPDGCAKWNGGGFDDCREIAECLVTIEDLPPDAICSILDGSCASSSRCA